jgi:hypothetical protein
VVVNKLNDPELVPLAIPPLHDEELYRQGSSLIDETMETVVAFAWSGSHNNFNWWLVLVKDVASVYVI